MRDAELLGPAPPLVAGDLADDRLGDVGELAEGVADRLAGEDVAGPDPDPFLVPEGREDRRQVLGPLAELGQLRADRRRRAGRRSTTSESIRSSTIPGLLIRISESIGLWRQSST